MRMSYKVDENSKKIEKIQKIEKIEKIQRNLK